MHETMVRVSEIMTKDVIHSIGKDASAKDAADQMTKVGRGCVVVLGKNGPVGIITERDLTHRVMAEGLEPTEVKVSEIMSKPVVTVGPEALVSDAAMIMAKNGIRRLPIVEGTTLVGIVTVTDFAKFLRRRPDVPDEMLAAMARAAELVKTVS